MLERGERLFNSLIIERLVGERRFLESTDPSRDVWGNFNELMQDAVVVCCDELDAKSQLQCEGKIKGLITNKNLTINPKGQKPFKMNSYHRFIFTTNKLIPISTHKNDRCNKVIRASDELCGNKDVFNEIRSYLNDDVVSRLLYEKFIKIEDLDTSYLLGIEQNKYQKILTETSISIPGQFLQDFTSRRMFVSEIEQTPEDLLNEFLGFKDRGGIKYECNATKLVQNLKLLKIPMWFTIHRTKLTRNLVININVLKEYFSTGYMG